MAPTAHFNDRGDGVVGLRATTDSMEVTTRGPVMGPDPGWSYTDPYGHTHTHQRRTWQWVYSGPEFWQDEDGEEHNGDGAFRCLVCGAEIEPGYVVVHAGGVRRFIQGPRYYWALMADGGERAITEDKAKEIMAGR